MNSLQFVSILRKLNIRLEVYVNKLKGIKNLPQNKPCFIKPLDIEAVSLIRIMF